MNLTVFQDDPSTARDAENKHSNIPVKSSLSSSVSIECQILHSDRHGKPFSSVNDERIKVSSYSKFFLFAYASTLRLSF